MSKRRSDIPQDEARKRGEAKVEQDGHNPEGGWEDEYEDEFESEDEVVDADMEEAPEEAAEGQGRSSA